MSAPVSLSWAAPPQPERRLPRSRFDSFTIDAAQPPAENHNVRPPGLICRSATAADAEALARIYNQGIESRTATFETRPRTAVEVLGWLDGTHPVVVAEDRGRVVAFASGFPYSARACYAGIAEVSIYVDRDSRGRGAGRAAGEALIRAAERMGSWKLVGKILAENAAGRALVRSLGFREVGVHQRHARLDGTWRDIVVVERLIGQAAAP